MKYEKGSPLDKLISEFPARYVFYILLFWLAAVIGLCYLGVTI